MQRLFSTFADGWPGGGLLLQRILAGGALVYCGALSLTKALHFELAVPQIFGAVAGVLILAGLWTPVAGTVAAAVELWIAFSQPNNMWIAAYIGGPRGQSGDDWPRGVVRRCPAFRQETNRPGSLEGRIKLPQKWEPRLSLSDQSALRPI